LPTYSYKCTECGTAFDIQQAFTDDSLTVCPNCGGKLRKVFSAIGVTFNGSGFYRTDSKAEAAAASKKSDDAKAPAKKSDAAKTGESSPKSTSDSSGSKAPAASPTKAAG
jgi:putative FmdB family regulatory protein